MSTPGRPLPSPAVPDRQRGSVTAVSRDSEHRFSKPNAELIRLVEGLGVEGDAHQGATVRHRSRLANHAAEPNLRQVHLIHGELHDELAGAGFEVSAGEMGENITTRGVDLLGLATRTRLEIGEEAVVEVTGLRNPCKQLDKFQPGLMAATLDRDSEGNLVRKAGIMAVVVKGGRSGPGTRSASWHRLHPTRLFARSDGIAASAYLSSPMSTDSSHPDGWYPDPFGRHEVRYYGAGTWTEHVSSHGRQAIDPPVGQGHVPTMAAKPEKVQRQVQQVAGAVGTGGGTIFTEPILVVNQKAKLIEVNNEYAIFDQAGRQIGAVRQVGQSTAKKVIRVMTSWDQFMTHKLQVVDHQGAVVLALTRPAKMIKSRVDIQDGQGRDLGAIVQQNAIGKIRFSLETGGHQVGSINAENWRAWNFNIADHTGTEVARITKTWEGLAKTMFTSADNYVVQIHRPLEEPLRSLVVAAALSVDTALKQDSRGFG